MLREGKLQAFEMFPRQVRKLILEQTNLVICYSASAFSSSSFSSVSSSSLFS